MSVKEFELYVRSQRPMRNQSKYVEELGRCRKVRNKYDSLLSFLDALSLGNPVKEWKSKGVDNDLLEMLYQFVNEENQPIEKILIGVSVSTILNFCPDRRRIMELVTNWEEAEKKGCLSQYFGEFDVFNVIEKSQSDVKCRYSGDYMRYINSKFEIDKRISLFRTYLLLHGVRVKLSENYFMDPIYFASTCERQINLYDRILKGFKLDNLRLVFFGDGYGTGKMISLIRGYECLSIEPNRIGNLAIELGIVDDYKIREIRENDVLVLFNVEEYLDESEIDGLINKYSRIIVVNESRVSKIGNSVDGTDKMVYSKGVEMFEKISVPPIVNVKTYLTERAPVCPVDVKSKIYSEVNDIPINNDKGFPISYGCVEGCFDIRGRGYPGKLDKAFIGEKKIFRRSEIKYNFPGEIKLVDGQVFEYFPDDPGNPVVIRIGSYRYEEGYYISVVRNPRRIKKVETSPNVLEPVYYVCTTSHKNPSMRESYFRVNNVGVAYLATDSGGNDN